MAKLSLVKGSTSQTVYVHVLNTGSSTISGKTGLLFNTAGLTAYYVRSRGNATAITLATLAAADSAWSSGGFKEVSSANMPGIYRLDIPDAALATGSNFCTVLLKGATTMAPCALEIELTGWDNSDSVRGGMTALPNAAAAASGGLFIRGTGAGAINQDANGRIDVNIEAWNTTSVPSEHTAGYPIVTVKDGTGTGEIDTASGAVLVQSGTGTGQISLSSGLVRLSSSGLDDILRTALTEAYAADGAAGTLSQILFGIQSFLQERSVSGTTVTAKKLDGTTTSMTFTLNDGTTPTSITRAT